MDFHYGVFCHGRQAFRIVINQNKTTIPKRSTNNSLPSGRQMAYTAGPRNKMMPYTTLISAAELAEHLDDPDWAVFDCRFSLADTGRGRRDYQAAHIPGALYAHLDDDLSGPVIAGQTGRHPLPDVETFTRRLSGWGIDGDVQVVAYDDANGGIAARLWWMLRWLGHEAVAVLDGGWAHWLKQELPARAGLESRSARRFKARPRPDMLVSTAAVETLSQNRQPVIFDSRTADRYRGENETIDPVAGHIPGAISAPYPENIGPNGLFLPRETLRIRFETLLGETPADQAVFYCGSGVTAAQNILALAHAGLGVACLYAGSWSQWISDPSRPVA
jgi:thiosulfate/3-mercaptopyruvate sulfurtransferase